MPVAGGVAGTIRDLTVAAPLKLDRVRRQHPSASTIRDLTVAAPLKRGPYWWADRGGLSAT